jgi:hypothetical protein
MIYLGDSWPEEYRGTLLVNNVHGNRVNREILVPDGSGFVGQHGPDFLLANDRWFRGINLKYGPAGSVYLIDWYDSQACHHNDQEVWNRGNGRMYKVVYGDTQPAHVNLAAMDESELVECVLHANDWYVRNARRLLSERGVSEAGMACVLYGACIPRVRSGQPCSSSNCRANRTWYERGPCNWPARPVAPHSSYLRGWK